jgi:hypothetical protein
MSSVAISVGGWCGTTAVDEEEEDDEEYRLLVRATTAYEAFCGLPCEEACLREGCLDQESESRSRRKCTLLMIGAWPGRGKNSGTEDFNVAASEAVENNIANPRDKSRQPAEFCPNAAKIAPCIAYLLVMAAAQACGLTEDEGTL